MVDAYVYLVDLPNNIHGFSVPGCNDDYMIYINCRLSREQQTATYLHEMKHIIKNDFDRSDVQTIEAEAHGGEK